MQDCSKRRSVAHGRPVAAEPRRRMRACLYGKVLEDNTGSEARTVPRAGSTVCLGFREPTHESTAEDEEKTCRTRRIGALRETV
jgi:hypothetical protein